MKSDYIPAFPRPAELERLALLAEECSEVIQMVGKILRFGWYDFHPDYPDGPSNAERLLSEVADVLTIIDLMAGAGDFPLRGATPSDKFSLLKEKKRTRLAKYTRFQFAAPEDGGDE